MESREKPKLDLREIGVAPGQIGSLAKGIAILDSVVQSDQPLRSQDIANRFDLDRSTAYRFLMTLEALGLLSKDAHSKTYTIGPKFTLWQRSLAGNRGLIALARPEIESLAVSTGQTAHLAILQGNDVELLEVAPSGAAVVVRQTPGDREPLYCTAVGKAILAFLPIRERHALMHQIQFQRFTETTITTLAALEIELTSIAQRRFATDNGEGSPHVTCIASPLMDERNYPVGSLGISAVRGTYPGNIETQTIWIEAVQAAATTVSKRLSTEGSVTVAESPELPRERARGRVSPTRRIREKPGRDSP
jgi:DNA-binding IclR family transcriptional regulator